VLERVLTACVVLASVACGDDANANETGGGAPRDGGQDAGISPTTRHPLDDVLRMSDVQAVGTHNSFHLRPPEPLFSEIATRLPPAAEAWEYSHRPLPEQFEDLGIRQIELDVYADPDGGLFASRAGWKAVDRDPASGLPELDEPGLKVLHLPDIDFETTCLTFVACLREVRAFSHAHPDHFPIAVLVEAKEDVVPDIFMLGFVTPLPVTASVLDTIEEEILAVFEPEEILTPDDVRGEDATLRGAIESRGWPRLREARGKIVFLLDNGGDPKAALVAGHPSLRGRILFASAEPPEDEAAFVKLNDPVADAARIRDLVQRGFMVRTRADGDTKEARTGDTSQREAAIASGAHWVSTDFPEPDPALGSDYHVSLDDRALACNPVTAPDACTTDALE
jgi:hypothetical protein